jgi:hypothetical protein
MGANLYREGAVIDLDATVLGWAVSPSRLNNVSEVVKHSRAKFVTPGKFATLVDSNTSIASTKPSHEGPEDMEWGYLQFCEETPHPMQGTVDYGEICIESVIGKDNMVGGLVWSFIIIGRRTHEAKIHKKIATTGREMFGRPIGRLFPDICLLLEVNISKGVVLEGGWCTCHMPR